MAGKAQKHLDMLAPKTVMELRKLLELAQHEAESPQWSAVDLHYSVAVYRCASVDITKLAAVDVTVQACEQCEPG